MRTDRKKGRILAAFVLACGIAGGVQLTSASALQMPDTATESAAQEASSVSQTGETAQESTTDTASAIPQASTKAASIRPFFLSVLIFIPL